MPTKDYTTVASLYNSLFSSQSRAATDPAAVTSNTQWDRDNLLHFIEDKFKSGAKGGMKLSNLRAFLHTLVKSARIQQDDLSYGVLLANSISVTGTNADRCYFGSQTYGFDYHYWSQSISTALSSVVLPGIIGTYANTGIDVPFEFKKFYCRGSVIKTNRTGLVDLLFYYTDNDDAVSTYLPNATFISSTQIDCSVIGDSYPFVISSNNPIPAGKKIFMFVRNTGWTSGSEYIRVSYTMYFESLSASWTVS